MSKYVQLRLPFIENNEEGQCLTSVTSIEYNEKDPPVPVVSPQNDKQLVWQEFEDLFEGELMLQI